MADWDADAAAYGAELATRRGAAPPATLGAIWQANWNAAGLDTFTGSGAPLAGAFNDLVDAATAKLGPLPAAAKARGLDYFGAPGFDGKAALIARMAADLPKDQQAELAPLLDIRSRAADTAAKIESDAADVAGRTYGLSGLATAWLAGVARQVVDPVNVALMAVGGPEGGGVITTLARQALIAGAGQAIQEPVIQANRRELGLDSGLGPALKDVAETAGGAAATTAVLGALYRGAAWALRNRAPAELPPAVNVSPADFDAAAHLADRDHVMAPADPAQLEAIARAVEAGNVFDATRELPIHAADRAGAPAGDTLESRVVMTGRPEVDAVLNEPTVRTRIEAPTIDASHDVPYLAGASANADDPTTHIDRHLPRMAEVSGVTFDPAVPANIHEQVERFVMERMIAAKAAELGRALTPDELDTIYEVAHHGYAEPAEDAWYRAHGIDVNEVNALWAHWDGRTEREGVPKNPPPDLYAKPYPHNKVEGSAKPESAVFDEWPTRAAPLSRRPLGEPAKTPAEQAAARLTTQGARGDRQSDRAGEQLKLGNEQVAADAARALADAGGDFEIELGEGDAARRVSATQALAELKDNFAAVRELEACLGGIAEEETAA
ncbi:MAG TPA: hypothetical protein VE993_01625 [Stellaceae bacterium]|nr:hypothetical protein [Stellaceae bacterium]